MLSPGSTALSCGSGMRETGVAAGCGAGGGAGAGTTGGINSSCGVCLPRLRQISPANTNASKATAPASHGQIEADEACVGAGSITFVGAGAAGSAEVLGSGTGVMVWFAGIGAASLLAAGCGVTLVRGNGATARAGAGPRGAGTAVVGALGLAVGLATGTGAGAGAGVGAGRGLGERMIGASLSTGPCARGSLVGRLPGIRKSGTDCAGADVGASQSASAMTLAAAFTLPPKSCIDCSIWLPSGRASASGTE